MKKIFITQLILVVSAHSVFSLSWSDIAEASACAFNYNFCSKVNIAEPAAHVAFDIGFMPEPPWIHYEKMDQYLSEDAEFQPITDCGQKDGIDIPCFGAVDKHPYYPYAQRPDGCSIPGKPAGTHDEQSYMWQNWAFTGACNEHDKCYYTIGETKENCNNTLKENLNTVCNEINDDWWDWFDPSFHASKAKCKTQVDIIYNGVIIGADSFIMRAWPQAQERQLEYEKNVAAFLDGERWIPYLAPTLTSTIITPLLLN